MTQWYYGKDGRQEGPIEEEVLLGLLRSGQLTPRDLVWKDGMAEWTPIQDVPELALVPTMPPATPPLPAEGTPVPAGAPTAHEPVPNYLVPSILATIFCCQPFGIVAIVYAAQVDGLLRQGKMAEAIDASRKAKMWMQIAVGGFLVVVVLYVVFVIGVTALGRA